MDGLGFFLFSVIVTAFFFSYKAFCIDACQPASCGDGEPLVRFPFRLKGRREDGCSFPRFDLSCNNRSQTVLNLPLSGDVVVQRIDYRLQTIFVDPKFCPTDRIQTFSLWGTPFSGSGLLTNYTFFNCSSSEWWDKPYREHRPIPLHCLSGKNYTIVAMPSNSGEDGLMPSSCRNLSTISVFERRRYGFQTLPLFWREPRCKRCELRGGVCGFKNGAGSEVGCSKFVPEKGTGLPRSAKYGIILGVGIPGLVCIIGLICFISSKIRDFGQSDRRHSELWAQSSNSRAPIITMGLDGSTIESFPKIVLGESKRLPEPCDGTCPICLSEYEPKETLRSLPECTHCFHAQCIDEWLRVNASCPVCRKSPESSSRMTPCSSLAMTTPLSSTSSSSTSSS